MAANVKLTWTDTSNNEKQFRVYRNSGNTTQGSGTWVHEPVPTGVNHSDSAQSVSATPYMSGNATDLDVTAGSADQLNQIRTVTFVDASVPAGTWTYVVSAKNDAGETLCTNNAEVVVTVT
jgi:hypothetical protein